MNALSSPTNIHRYSAWIRQHREASIAQGGQPFTARQVTEASRLYLEERAGLKPQFPGLSRGEILNPETGEIHTGCLSINSAVSWLWTRCEIKTTSRAVIAVLEKEGVLDRLIDWDNVPMVSNPAVTKPDYYARHVASRAAMQGGFAVSFPMTRKGSKFTMTVLTPAGLGCLAEWVDERRAAGSQKAKVRKTVAHLVESGHRQAEIVRLTGYSKQLVSYHLKALRAA
ncbi:hypothetical protein LB524_00145 [Mesorhizobium sp. ESP6-5]|uniref:hypothetical protein n=1 Tax=Mesorhizobium sp. ESP6-5 TaxID=2876623 RepID=UPI001CCAC8EB|nr:hypothetical protein [Mesorhizobium sp. ESP6-5]MBZ9753684.1 hypothetical protein [Mesorhizobium sp. ESP6-5]